MVTRDVATEKENCIRYKTQAGGLKEVLVSPCEGQGGCHGIDLQGAYHLVAEVVCAVQHLGAAKHVEVFAALQIRRAVRKGLNTIATN